MSQRRRSTSVGGSSSNAGGKVLPLIACPRCHNAVIRLVSKQPETYGWPFYKCEMNDQDDATTCGFWKWEHDYETILRRRNLLPAAQTVAVGQIQQRCGPVQIQGDTEASMEVNQDRDAVGIWTSLQELKIQVTDLNMKFDLATKQWGVAVVVAAIVAFLVGLVVAVVVRLN